MDRLNLLEYQRQVRNGLFIAPDVDPLSHLALGLTGEAGEVADLVKKSQYINGSLSKTLMLEELGDVLWYWTAMVDRLGMDIDGVAYANIWKLEQRHGPNHYNTKLLTMVPA